MVDFNHYNDFRKPLSPEEVIKELERHKAYILADIQKENEAMKEENSPTEEIQKGNKQYAIYSSKSENC